MTSRPIAILGTGLVTSVGFTAAACGCAFRTKITNPSETPFINSTGALILAHQVKPESITSGLTKLAKMAVSAIEEALRELPKDQWQQLPMLLCVAETERQGRMAGLDNELLALIQNELDVIFAHGSAVIAQGRVGVAVALAQARTLLQSPKISGVLIVSSDSLLSRETLAHYDSADRLLTELSSNGFIPGEGAGALWIGATKGVSALLLCTGIGFGHETAHINSGKPLRADGLVQAIKVSLADANRHLHDMDFRITDNSGEQYYFKEASLALTRTLRERKEVFDIWHPAECTGEIGATAGISVIATASEACRKGYAPGPRILTHWANDGGQRAAVVLEFRG